MDDSSISDGLSVGPEARNEQKEDRSVEALIPPDLLIFCQIFYLLSNRRNSGKPASGKAIEAALKKKRK
jgi:hypothetical protein